MREDVYTHIANGADMVEYWHWASIAANQETYWKGVLSHDFEPNRAYAEVSRTAHELQKIDYTQGGYIIPYYAPVIDGYSKRVHGLVPCKTGFVLSNGGFKNFWLSKA